MIGEAAVGGELSKREGVLFHWWSFSSKRNEKLLAVLPRYKVNMNFKHHILVGCLFEKMFRIHKASMRIQGIMIGEAAIDFSTGFFSFTVATTLCYWKQRPS